MKTLRIATYNIHKGVQGVWLWRRLEIHNLRHAIEQLDVDILCLQEVRLFNHQESKKLAHWPSEPQADFLATSRHQPVYRTNAITKYGEHGNAILSAFEVANHFHQDISDHPFEQRGLLHTVLHIDRVIVHVICVHLGLIRAGRIRQLERLIQYIECEIPDIHAPLVVAGDFNDGRDVISPIFEKQNLQSASLERSPTFPSRLPLLQLDHIYVRGLRVFSCQTMRGRGWSQYSDHLPLVAECLLG